MATSLSVCTFTLLFLIPIGISIPFTLPFWFPFPWALLLGLPRASKTELQTEKVRHQHKNQNGTRNEKTRHPPRTETSGKHGVVSFLSVPDPKAHQRKALENRTNSRNHTVSSVSGGSQVVRFPLRFRCWGCRVLRCRFHVRKACMAF